MAGISERHAAHQVAQKLISTGCPRSALSRTVPPSSVPALKSMAGDPTARTPGPALATAVPCPQAASTSPTRAAAMARRRSISLTLVDDEAGLHAQTAMAVDWAEKLVGARRERDLETLGMARRIREVLGVNVNAVAPQLQGVTDGPAVHRRDVIGAGGQGQGLRVQLVLRQVDRDRTRRRGRARHRAGSQG